MKINIWFQFLLISLIAIIVDELVVHNWSFTVVICIWLINTFPANENKAINNL